MEYPVYYAPMEGITNYRYRRIHENFFPEADRYYSPFLSPTSDCLMTWKERREVSPEENKGVLLIPQILTARADLMIELSKELHCMGYPLINLNLGCPSGTVVAKGKGAGMLQNPEALEQFLDSVMNRMSQEGIRLSVKSRIGLEDPAEYERLLSVFCKFPLEELILHPRTRRELYKGGIHEDSIAQTCIALANAPYPIQFCLNGNLFTAKGVQDTLEQFAQLPHFESITSLMVGRGAVANPALIRELKGGKKLEITEFKTFHDAILQDTESVMTRERNTLFRMKEFWYYWSALFQPADKCLKQIRKCNSIPEYKAVVRGIINGTGYRFSTERVSF